MRFLPFALILSLPGAALAASSAAEVDYVCADGRGFQASFINAGDEAFAVIFEAGRLVTMKIAQSASGARYLSPDEKLELWTKGDGARVTLLGEEETVLYRDCREMVPAR